MDENQDTRCSACGARLPGDADWCTLCYAVQRRYAVQRPGRTPEPATVAADVSVMAAASGRPGSHDLAAEVPASSPATGSAAADVAEAEALADQLLARLAAQSRPVPSTGLLSRSLSTAHGRAGVAALGVGAVTFVVLALMGAGGSVL